jgi:hypothetical protein
MEKGSTAGRIAFGKQQPRGYLQFAICIYLFRGGEFGGIAIDKRVLQGYPDTGHAAVECCTAFQESGKVSRLVLYRRIGTLLGTGPKTIWTH